MSNSDSSLPLRLIVLFGLVMAGVTLFLTMNPGFENEVFTEGPLDSEAVSDSGPMPGVERISDTQAPSPARAEPASMAGEEAVYAESDREILKATILASTVKGRIIDEKGLPVQEAKVQIDSAFPEFLRDVVPLGDYSASAVTDAEGAFEIPVPVEGAFKYRVERKGYATSPTGLALPEDDLVITLQRGLEVTGVVLNEETEAPLEGAWVRAVYRMVSSVAETDKKGVFTIRDCPKGTVHLEVFHPHYDVKRLRSIFLKAEGDNVLRILLKEGAPLTGVVLDRSTGNPIEGVNVTYAIGYREEGETKEVYREELTTDRQGYFEFEKVSHHGFRLQIKADGYTSVFHDSSRFKPPPDPPGTPIKIFLRKEGALSGVVYDPDGIPTGGAEIKVFQQELWENREITVRSSPEGGFSLKPLGAGSITLLAAHADHGPVILQNIDIPQGDTLEGLEIYLTRSSGIHGQVRGFGEEPVKGARVVIDGLKPLLYKAFKIYPVTLTDSKGCFSFNRLPEGEYRVAASKDHLRCEPVDILLQTGQSLMCDLDLQTGLAFSGIISDAFGDPLDDVLVTAFASDEAQRENKPKDIRTKSIDARLEKTPQAERPGRVAEKSRQDQEGNRPLWRKFTYYRGSCRSGPDGRFYLSGLLPHDLLMIRCWKEGYISKTISDLSVATGEIQVQMDALCQLQGLVLDGSTFLPLPAFTVVLRTPKTMGPDFQHGPAGPYNREFYFRRDDGSFLVDSVPPGFYETFVKAKGYQAPKPVPVHLYPGQSVPFVRFDMDLSGTLRGRVLAKNQAPIGGISVYIRPGREGGLSAIGKEEEQKKKNKKKNPKQKGPAGKRASGSAPSTAPKPVMMKTRTNEDGRFVFRELKPAVYEILLGNPRKPLAKPKGVGVTEGEVTSSAFILRDLGSLELTVQDDSGFSLMAEVILSGGPAELYLKTGSSRLGMAKIRNLVPGSYKLTIHRKGYRTHKQAIEIKNGKESELEIYLSPKPAKGP